MSSSFLPLTGSPRLLSRSCAASPGSVSFDACTENRDAGTLSWVLCGGSSKSASMHLLAEVHDLHFERAQRFPV